MDWKKVAWNLLKFGISLTIIAFLTYKVQQEKGFDALLNQPKDWFLLALAAIVMLGSISLTFVRWYLLVRAIDIPFSLKDAFRLGFIGYLFTFLTVGVVGGDLLKAIFLAREHKDRKGRAIGTVILDRALGLYALIIVASLAYLYSGWESIENPSEEMARLIFLGRTTITLATLGTLFIVIFVVMIYSAKQRWKENIDQWLETSKLLARLYHAVELYRQNIWIPCLGFLLGICTHGLGTLAVYLVAVGLPGKALQLGDFFMISPIATLAGSLPLPGGLGAYESALHFLYNLVSQEADSGQGFIIAACIRVITILIALIGGAYYLYGRREVDNLVEQAETMFGSAEEGTQDQEKL